MALGPWRARSSWSSMISMVTSFPAAFASARCAEMWARSLSLQPALTTMARTPSPRFVTMVSSRMPPSAEVSSESVAAPGLSPGTSATTRPARKAGASFPRKRSWPMWLTSNRPASERTKRWESLMPSGYWTGMEYPAKGTIFPPSSMWRSWRRVCLRGPEERARARSGAAGRKAGEERRVRSMAGEAEGGTRRGWGGGWPMRARLGRGRRSRSARRCSQG
mmetsp:Transcript_1831/g.4964  ORF Transcript_1831/g.4964 Transcript_1831/m.4964 type:complete len:221 (+) Transcript_1831:809-1471(+)